MKNKTILASWCSEPNCKFIDDKHIQIELLAHMWYSNDNDSKTDVINKKLCFVKEIDFNELNYEVEILDNEEKEKPLTKKDVEALGYACGEIKKCFENGWNKSLNNKPFEEDKKIEKIGNDYYHKTQPEQNQIFQRKINEIIDILKKGNKNE